MGELKQGAVFSGYRVERRIGLGGMGVVYEAVEESLDRRVALKLLAPEVARDPAFRQRFEVESRIAAQVEHPNVVPIYAVGEQDDVLFLAMRLISGPNLAAKITELRHLEPVDAGTVVGKVAAGLDAIHAAGLIHRDVKPANILMGEPNGREDIYITDFGLAKHAAQASEDSQGGRFLGTLDYVSPEQIRGDPVDARADVYALGCVLYKALTGEAPFPREEGSAKLWAHVNEEPPRPSLTPGVPETFDAIVARAMAKRPGERYASAGDLGRAALAAAEGDEAALGAIPKGEETTTKLPRPKPPAGARRKRRLGPVLLVGAVIVGALVPYLIAQANSGGRSEEAQRFIDSANQICARSRHDYNRFAAATPNNSKEAARQVDGMIAATAGSLARLRALRPPGDMARQYEVYLAQRQLMLYQLHQANRAIGRGDVEAFRAAFARIQAQQPLRADSAAKLGLEKCSPGR